MHHPCECIWSDWDVDAYIAGVLTNRCIAVCCGAAHAQRASCASRDVLRSTQMSQVHRLPLRHHHLCTVIRIATAVTHVGRTLEHEIKFMVCKNSNVNCGRVSTCVSDDRSTVKLTRRYRKCCFFMRYRFYKW